MLITLQPLEVETMQEEYKSLVTSLAEEMGQPENSFLRKKIKGNLGPYCHNNTPKSSLHLSLNVYNPSRTAASK